MFLFKQHFAVDLQTPIRKAVSSHHRRNARKALQRITVEQVEQPDPKTWIALYDNLIRRHEIRGVAAFSAESHTAQLLLPGLTTFRATFEGETIGMILWLQHGETAYYHLAAYSDTGYIERASFALFWHSIEHFQANGAVRWLSLGAGAGVTPDTTDGLTRFKRGWATDTFPAYLCGRILDEPAYAAATAQLYPTPTRFFPAYRAGEIA